MNRNNQALKALAITLAALTYCGAVLYGDIMFISVMHVAFPDGILGTLALAGAIMTAVSAITLPIALHWWFSPGMQFVWGVIFWFADIAALSLNAILAYAVATGHADANLLLWQQISPATPMLAVIGWGIAFLLDPSHKLRHAQAELEADLIDIHSEQLRQAAKGDDVSTTITTGAKQAAADTAARLTGQRVAAAIAEIAGQSGNGHTKPVSAFARETAEPPTTATPRQAAIARIEQAIADGKDEIGYTGVFEKLDEDEFDDHIVPYFAERGWKLDADGGSEDTNGWITIKPAPGPKAPKAAVRARSPRPPSKSS